MIRHLFIAAMFTPSIGLAQEATAPAGRLLQGATEQIGKTVRYDPSYEALAFPGGDVPLERGVCTDVIVRAYRAIGVDLQLLVNQDMRQSFGAYPKLWGLSRPDPNIDHRRVPNLAVFFGRHGKTLQVSRERRDYKPGDIVTWRLPDGRPHIGLVSGRESGGVPLIVHNIGQGAREEDVLFSFQITGHYRFRLDPA
jgi:uncharacterized protein YijF (DUF1287 family)